MAWPTSPEPRDVLPYDILHPINEIAQDSTNDED
jgi:hypothetical protein